MQAVEAVANSAQCFAQFGFDSHCREWAEFNDLPGQHDCASAEFLNLDRTAAEIRGVRQLIEVNGEPSAPPAPVAFLNVAAKLVGRHDLCGTAVKPESDVQDCINIVPVDYPAPADCVGDNFAARHDVRLARGWPLVRCSGGAGRIRPLPRTMTSELLEEPPSGLSMHRLEKTPTWHR
ncbi:MAG: hypothetical protein ACJ8AH_10785 [Stellaceae bacterium]